MLIVFVMIKTKLKTPLGCPCVFPFFNRLVFGITVSIVGRGRAENSRFYILASEDKSVAEREWTNSLKEPMMEDAMLIVQQEIATNNERFQLQKQELQRLAKRQREAAAQNKGVREVPDGQYVLRYGNKCLKEFSYNCIRGLFHLIFCTSIPHSLKILPVLM